MLVRRHETYYLRRRMPLRLQPYFQLREIWISLRTGDRIVAKVRWHRLMADIDDLMARAAAILDNATTHEELERASELFDHAETLIESRRVEAEALAAKTGELRAVMRELRLLQEHQAAAERFHRAVQLLAKTDERARQSEHRGEVTAAALAEARSSLAVVTSAIGRTETATPLFSELVEPFFNAPLKTLPEAQREAAAATQSQDRATLRLWLELVGDRPVGKYLRADVTTFLERARQLPYNYRKSLADKDLPLEEAIQRAIARQAQKHQHDVESGHATGDFQPRRLTKKTLKRHTTALSNFFDYCVDRSYISRSSKIDLISGHRLKAKRTEEPDPRDQWSPEDLQTLFASPVWHGCHPFFRSRPGPQIIRDACFWLPLVCTFQGFRLEEAADLVRGDVLYDTIAELWAIRIAAGERIDRLPDGNKRVRHRSIKTRAARRTVAIHPELLKLGFVNYICSIAPEARDPLFPDLEPQGKLQKRGPRITRWFGNYRRQIGIFRPGVASHAFRHTVSTRLRGKIRGQLGDYQAKRHVDFMLGHAREGSTGDEVYDHGLKLREAAGTLFMLEYPELDFSHLHVADPVGIPAWWTPGQRHDPP